MMPPKPIRKTKSKLTLSVGPKYVYMLRRASARRGRSITESAARACANEVTEINITCDIIFRNYEPYGRSR